MADAGHKETEEILAGIEKRIAQEYRQAEKEVSAKLDDYLKRFETKDKLKRKALDNGLITQEEYDKWRIGQIMIGERWTKMRDSIAQDFTKASEIAKGIAFDKMPDVYALNFNYGTYQVEKGARMDTSFTLYDRNAVQELMKNEDTFIPAPGKKVQRDINEGKTLAWNKKQVQSVMLQGILQGESIPNLATRLAKAVGDSDRKASVRNARTMTTGVQNAGRVASYERANDMGIETQKQWLATLDDRTRHEHAALDGVTVPYDEPFENEYGEIDYPGDPAADPGNIFNCRCTLIPSIKGFERDVSDMNLRHDDHLGDMTYDEWKAGKYEQTSDPITKQDTVSEIMKEKYIDEYNKATEPKRIEDNPVTQNEEVSSNIKFDFKGKEEKYEKPKEILLQLEQQYNTRLENVTIGAPGSAGDVDISGATLRLNSNDPATAIHEFAHTLANSQADKYGLTNNEEFWKEIDKIRRDYRREVGQDSSKWISSYEHSHKSKDEFFAEAFTQAKMRELGLEIPAKYGDDFTYSQRVLDTVDKYFGKEQNVIANLGNDGIIKAKDIIIGKSLGAKALNYDIELPDGSKTHITEGTRIENITVIAGKGKKRKIDEIDTLLARYGGVESEWQKKKGLGYVDYEGESYRAELHWYEEPSAGRHDWKVKPDADGNWFQDEY